MPDDVPTRGSLQPQSPDFLRRLETQEAREMAQRLAGTYRYTGPLFPWMGPGVTRREDPDG